MASIISNTHLPFYVSSPKSCTGRFPGSTNRSIVAISVVLVITVYVIYWYGPVLRKRSPFAQQLIDARAETHNRILEQHPEIPMGKSNQLARSQQSLRIRQTMGSRTGSFVGSRANSRVNSRVNSRANSRRNSLS